MKNTINNIMFKFKLNFYIGLNVAIFSCSCCTKNSVAELTETNTQKRELPSEQSKKVQIGVKKHIQKYALSIGEYCNEVNAKFDKFNWNKIICNPKRWRVFSHTKEGRPLMYQEFGFDKPENKGPINLFICGVHGNEPSGIYLCFHLARDILFDNPQNFNYKLVIAPIVSPDGFAHNTRTNANGVDPNRNLPTKDFEKMAMKVWKSYGHAKQKFPGTEPGSEIESQFQAYLIQKYKPDKIVSVHAPYGFLDFDGPGDRKYYNLIRVEQRAKYLALNMEANSNKFLKVVDFRFFPGSLGNYAGNERKIPTYTLELPSTSPAKAPGYWEKLQFALTKALAFKVYDGERGNPFIRAQEKLIKTRTKADQDAEAQNKTD